MNTYASLTRRTPRRLRSRTLQEAALTRTDLQRIIRRTTDPQISDKWEKAETDTLTISRAFEDFKASTLQEITNLNSLSITHGDKITYLEKKQINGDTAQCLTPAEVTAICNAIFNS